MVCNWQAPTSSSLTKYSVTICDSHKGVKRRIDICTSIESHIERYKFGSMQREKNALFSNNYETQKQNTLCLCLAHSKCNDQKQYWNFVCQPSIYKTCERWSWTKLVMKLISSIIMQVMREKKTTATTTQIRTLKTMYYAIGWISK